MRRDGGSNRHRSPGGAGLGGCVAGRFAPPLRRRCAGDRLPGHVERILPVIDEALRKAGLSLSQIDAVAVANTPGLAGSLLVGLAAAKAICVAREIPLIAVNHLQAHVFACRLAAGREVFPVRGPHRQRRPQQSLPMSRATRVSSSSAAPSTTPRARPSTRWQPCWACRIRAGRRSSARAQGGDPRAHAFPRPFLRDDRLDFSFSGLKTAVRIAIAGTRSARSEHRQA